MRKTFFLGLLLLTLLSFTNRELKGRIVRVVDGDTVVLLVAEEEEEVRVRLDGIDAPEKGQPFSNRSKQFLEDRCHNQEVLVKVKGKDRYGRVLGVIMADGSNLNEALVRNGFAWHYKHFSKDIRLDSLERLARQEELNIWSMKDPVQPYEYRKSKRKK